MCRRSFYLYSQKLIPGGVGDIEIKIEINETHFVLSFTDKGLPIDISFPKAAAYTIDTVEMLRDLNCS
jgi:hypothetical protein